MIEIDVRDFQSIEGASITIDGFTALVGRSNIGKSAFVRAVQAALTGAPVTSCVRHGASCNRRTRKKQSCSCFCSVHIKTNGFDLLWEKGDAVNRYTFNGTVYDKASQGTPDFLADYVSHLKMGDHKELLQVAEQFNPIFLLNQSGSVVADVLGDVAQLNRINVALSLVERDRREAVNTRKVREGDIATLRQELILYHGLDDAQTSINETGAKFNAVSQQRAKASALIEFQSKHVGADAEVTKLAQVESILPPDPTPLLGRARVYEKVSRYATQVADRATVIRFLSGIENVTIPGMEKIVTGVQTFKRLDAWVEGLYVFQAWFDARLPATKTTVPNTEKHAQAYERYERIRGFARRYESVLAAMSALGEELAETERLEAETNREFDALGVCPTCAQPLHSGGHAE